MSYFSSRRDQSSSSANTLTPTPQPPPAVRTFLLLERDYRPSLHPLFSRFLGYRSESAKPPYDPLPIPPFCWLVHIPLKYEVWLFAFIGSFGSILLLESIASTHTVFHDVYGSPLIITSFGAASVLLFGVIESPLAQPRNLIFGNFAGALIGTAITKLFTLNGNEEEYKILLENREFHGRPFINGGLTVSVTLLVTLILGLVHPPSGATALAAATEPFIVTLSWTYLPIILCSSLLVLAWALFINNLGRRRYPTYWWAPGRSFVMEPTPEPRARGREEVKMKRLEEGVLRSQEDGGRAQEG
ncbi:hypothetical protein CI109_104984 [Kwoniella shandongensis]|uniref:HPP transmembrane region domain-containing protein n=1 Tax=Kwoniella shandongensis TaxID=1734106 RepID=A0A5M6BTQ7_9TREE|nr:uncharacterized protein CI109_006699 [Kwoniella shandongensis]KAA5524975.1 hypothetical protein CI109_006699 [Kwoniella shandongensis]